MISSLGGAPEFDDGDDEEDEEEDEETDDDDDDSSEASDDEDARRQGAGGQLQWSKIINLGLDRTLSILTQATKFFLPAFEALRDDFLAILVCQALR